MMSGNRSSLLSSSGGGSGIGGGGLMGETLGIPETIRIEHTFTFNVSDNVWSNLHRFLGWRDNSKAVRHTIKQILDLSKEYAESFRFIAVGIGSYFFFLGVAKVLEAGGNHDRGSDSNKDSDSGKKSSSSSKRGGAPSDDRSAASTKSKASSRRRKHYSTESINNEGSSSRMTTMLEELVLEGPQTPNTSATPLETTTGWNPGSMSDTQAAPTIVNTETAPEIMASLLQATPAESDEGDVIAA
jgi:hypothetical protein